MRFIFVFSFLFIFGCSALAQKVLIERTIEIESNEKNPVAARQAMISDATEKISEELIKEIIGESKLNRNKSVIINKVYRQSARYVPYAKPGDLKALPGENGKEEGFKMALTLKVSLDDLQTVLLENGLFYETDGTPVVLPFIQWNDKTQNQIWGWWMGGQVPPASFLRQNKRFEEALRGAFWKNGFYLQRPTLWKTMELLLPSERVAGFRFEDGQNLSQKLGAPIWLQGEVSVSKSQTRSDAFLIQVKMNAIQNVNGRVIAEVARQYESDPGVFEMVLDRKIKEVVDTLSVDLSNQVLEAWQKGAIGASLYRLTLKGRLPLQQQEAFKETIKSRLREVKNIRERLISADEIIFEVDSALSPKDFGQKLSKIEVAGFQIMLESTSDTDLTYRLMKKTEDR